MAEQSYGDWTDWLLCLGIVILLETRWPMSRRNPDGHSPRWWNRHPAARLRIDSSLKEQKQTQTPKEAHTPIAIGALWLWRGIWEWQFVAWLLASICVGLGFLVAQQHIYWLTRILVTAGAMIAFLKVRHSAAEEMSESALSVVSVITLVFLIFTVAGGFWIVNRFETDYIASLPRAHIEVEDVKVEVEMSNGFPWDLLAHISGHNASITPTGLSPIVKAGIKIVPIAHNIFTETPDVFSDASGLYANETYMKFNGRLYAGEAFSFDKREPLVGMGNQPFASHTLQDLVDRKLVVYVLTRTIYSDQWGPLPEDHHCWPLYFDKSTNRWKMANIC